MSSNKPGSAVEIRQPVCWTTPTGRSIAELRADGRLSMRALAEKLHISRASAYTRVERLVAEGVITGYSASIDPERYGFGISAYVYLKISQHSWKAVRRRITADPRGLALRAGLR